MECEKFQENKVKYYCIRDKLHKELHQLGRYISEFNEEKDDSYKQINTILEHVNDTNKKWHLQLGIYTALLSLTENVKKISDGVADL